MVANDSNGRLEPPQPELRQILAKLGQLEEEVRRLRQPGQTAPPQPPADMPAEQPVTLDEIAVMVGRRKRTLRHYMGADPPMPPPRYRGRRGQPNQWEWSEVRPWLEARFGRRLDPVHSRYKVPGKV